MSNNNNYSYASPLHLLSNKRIIRPPSHSVWNRNDAIMQSQKWIKNSSQHQFTPHTAMEIGPPLLSHKLPFHFSYSYSIQKKINLFFNVVLLIIERSFSFQSKICSWKRLFWQWRRFGDDSSVAYISMKQMWNSFSIIYYEILSVPNSNLLIMISFIRPYYKIERDIFLLSKQKSKSRARRLRRKMDSTLTYLTLFLVLRPFPFQFSFHLVCTGMVLLFSSLLTIRIRMVSQ